MPAQKSAKPLKSAPGTAAKAATKTAAKAPAKAASQKAAAAPAPVAKKVKTVPVKSSAELTKAADELLKPKPPPSADASPRLRPLATKAVTTPTCPTSRPTWKVKAKKPPKPQRFW